MTVSEYIFDFLSNKGLDSVFMVSGSSSMWLTDALQRESRYNIICNHHEQACAMSAEVYSRITGKPAICLVTVGPGATNAITGVAGAYVDSAPMIVLSGQASRGMLNIAMKNNLRQQGTQSLLLDEMVKPVTKYFATVMDENEIGYHMEQAFHAATNGRPGPVWLDIPVDVQNKQISVVPYIKDAEISKSYDTDKFDKLCLWIKNAKRPLVLAGYGITISRASELLLRLIEAYQIPIVTTRMGIDLIESNHPLYVGRPGAYGDRASHYALQNCDLLLCIGTRMAVSCVGYDGAKFAQRAKKILVDIDETEIQKNYVPMDEVFKMDAKVFLSILTDRMQHNNSRDLKHPGEWTDLCASWKESYRVVLPEYKHEEPLNSYFVTDEISKRASSNCAVIVDTGTVCNVASQTWRIKKGQRYIISGGISCMGYWCGVIGAAQTLKGTGRYAIALVGDGSFQMNAQELATIQYNKLPVKIFIFSNDGYLLIRLNQHNYMNDRFLGVGSDSGLGMPDFVKLSEAYGIKALHIRTLEELDLKLNEVFDYSEPIVCVIDTKKFQELIPRMSSKVLPDGSLKASEYEDLFPFLSDEEHKKNMNRVIW